VLAALHQARSTGLGQHVDVSMLGVMTAMVACEPFDLLERCGVPQRTGLTVPRLAPFGIYRTLDGHVAICAPTEAFAAGLFRALDRKDLAENPKFRTRDDRVRNVDELNGIIEDYTRSVTTAEIVALLEAAGVPSAPVRTPDEAVRDPQVLARGETVKLSHPKYGEVADVYGMGLPIRFSGARVGFDQDAPGVGEHNEAVYGGLLGYSAEKLRELREKKVI
jgi:crotonobetainyl-CoA:carnitine CoA-transferase CaiB-like acyl-CoA transferase